MSSDENIAPTPDEVIEALGYDPSEVTALDDDRLKSMSMDDVEESDDVVAGDLVYTYLLLASREKELLRDRIDLLEENNDLLNERLNQSISPVVVSDVLEQAGISKQTTDELLSAMLRLSKDDD